MPDQLTNKELSESLEHLIACGDSDSILKLGIMIRQARHNSEAKEALTHKISEIKNSPLL